MKVNTYEAVQHIAPFIETYHKYKDYKANTLRVIYCFITNDNHNPVLLRGSSSSDGSIRLIVRMLIDMVNTDTYVLKDQDLEYTHRVIKMSYGEEIKHRIQLIAGDSTYQWEWIFLDNEEGTL